MRIFNLEPSILHDDILSQFLDTCENVTGLFVAPGNVEGNVGHSLREWQELVEIGNRLRHHLLGRTRVFLDSSEKGNIRTVQKLQDLLEKMFIK